MLTVNSNNYIFDSSTYKAKKGWIEYNNHKYYANPKTGILSRLVTEIDGKKYFFGNTTLYMWTGLIEFYGDYYYADQKTGQLQSGMLTVNSNNYIFDSSTYKAKKGWIEYNNHKYYADLTTGVLQKGIILIDGNYYKFDDNYILQNGWLTVDNKTYYIYFDGTKAKGLVRISGQRYLFSSSGELLTTVSKAYIDLSSAQTSTYYDGSRWRVNIDSIDWKSIHTSGEIDGVILKAGSGSLRSGKSYQINDDFITKAVAKCKEFGISFGMYWYSYAEPYANDYYSETINEANIFIDYIKRYSPDLGVYWDLEENRSADQYNIMVPKFMEIMHNNGIDAKIYCNKEFANNRLYNFKSYISWIAHYTGSHQNDGSWSKYPNRLTDYTGWNMWQYTDAANVTGINGYVDMNITR